MEKKKPIKKWFYWFSLAIAVVCFYKILDNYGNIAKWIGDLFGILTPFLIGILIAYILFIPCRAMERMLSKSKVEFIKKNSKNIGIFIIYLIVLAIIMFSIKFLIPVIIQSMMDLVANFQGYFNSLIVNLNNLPGESILNNDVARWIIDNIKNINLEQYLNIESLLGYAKGVINAATGILDVFISVIVSIYVLSERRKILLFIKKLINALFKPKVAKKISNYFNRTNQILLKFICSQFIDAIVVGILTSIAMKILGVKYGLTLGILIGISNLIPYFGAIVGVTVAIIITAFTGGFSQAIIMGIIIIILQQIDANIINPKIVGNSLKISPLLVIFAVTIGGAYYGMAGMFFAVPISAVLKIIVIDFIEYKNRE